MSKIVLRVRYALNSETGERVAIKIIDKVKLKKQPGVLEQIEQEVRRCLDVSPDLQAI
jgi:hypothetical protein